MKKFLLLIIMLSCAFLLKAQRSDKSIALDLVVKNSTAIGLASQEIENSVVSDSYFDKNSGAQMVYLQQTYQGIRIYNQLLVLAFKNGALASKSGEFIKSVEKRTEIKNAIPSITADAAVQAALEDRKLTPAQRPDIKEKNYEKYEFGTLGVARQNITAQLTWVPIADGKRLRLAWQVYVVPINSSDIWMIRVSATNRSVLGMDNYTVYCNWDLTSHNQLPGQNNKLTQTFFDFNSSESASGQNLSNSPSVINSGSYRVIPFPAESPIHPGGTNALITNPWLSAPGNATSLKWNSDGITDYTITRGNNVWAQEDRNNNNGTGVAPTATSSPDPLVFNFIPNFSVAPTQTTPVPNQQFNTTNLFYWNNIVHDITYQYGFDEVSGNFQANNQGRGGNGNDYVLADAQDGGGTNNANFGTPPDGTSGRMQMYLWNGNPQKDGDADNGVIVHEYGHGISTRLTGGPSNSGCLSSAEQMGEGWSDYYGLMYTQNWATSNLNTGFNSPRGIGTYVIGEGPTGDGIRNQKYCTNFAVNNQVYNFSISAESHNRGEIWCATLWDMTWNIINQVGTINPNIYNPAGGGGNTIALRLVTEALKLQPCGPGFIDGRDAIIKADQLLYAGAYECAIREAFRRRGMGAFASQGSAGSVTDQIPDYTLNGATVVLTQNGMTQVGEGGLITYTNTVTAGNCGPVSDFILTDTLPSNVTYVSGGTYNSATRVVTFNVNLTTSQVQTYTFVVRVNVGAYFPTVNLFEDNVPGPGISSAWTETSTTGNHWVVSSARSHSAPDSYFSGELEVTSDERLLSNNSIALGATPPPLSFWHWYNTESTYDGGVVEISTNGGTTWTDLGPNIIKNGYTGTMDASTLLAGRRAFTGGSGAGENFIKTKINLASFANQNAKFRFRFTSDEGTAAEGWYVDDIGLINQAEVEMSTNLILSNGTVAQTSDTITVIIPCTGVSVATQPAATTACTGGSATFTIVAGGTTPSYQWQVSTNGGTTWTDIVGATSATLSLTAVTATLNNNLYRVILNNSCSAAPLSSGSALLTVSASPSITLQPVNTTVCLGSNTTFTVATSGGTPAYQWQVSTDGGTTFTNIPGATSATLTVTGVTEGLNGNVYHVQIFSCDPAGTSSGNATLSVSLPVSITAQPANANACLGEDATIAVTASGTGNTYQWQVSTNGGGTFTAIPGATSATLILTSVTSALNNNIYHVVISNSCTPSAVTSANATLILTNSAVITTQPVNTTTCEGANAIFTANASGVSYQWQVSTDNGATFTNIPGATTTTLTLPTVSFANNNSQYQLLIGSCGGTFISTNHVTLSVTQLTSITGQPLSTTVCDGTDAIFIATATGTSTLYQWSVSTDGGLTYTPITGATDDTLIVANVTATLNNNLYQVTISNSCTTGITSTAASLTVNPPTTVTTQPSGLTACDGSSVTFTAGIGNAPSNISYQWQVSTDGGTTFADINGANNATLTLSGITASMTNNLYHLIVNGCGTVTSDAAALTVNALPTVVITASPYSSLTSNSTTTLTATSTPPAATFSWYKNNVLIAGATGATIDVTHDELGDYTASVADINGCSNKSNLLSITDSLVNIAFISPNPNSGQFVVRFDGTSLNGQPRIITMYDSKGARVFSQSYVTSFAFEKMYVNAGILSRGVYVLILSDVSGKTLGTGKVVIR